MNKISIAVLLGLASLILVSCTQPQQAAAPEGRGHELAGKPHLEFPPSAAMTPVVDVKTPEGIFPYGYAVMKGQRMPIPDHYWILMDNNDLIGLHFGSPTWTDDKEKHGELLYIVEGKLGPADADPAPLKSQGFVHFHSLAYPAGYTGTLYGYWLRHVAVTDFMFGGMMGQMMPGAAHLVKPGIDYQFMNVKELVVGNEEKAEPIP